MTSHDATLWPRAHAPLIFAFALRTSLLGQSRRQRHDTIRIATNREEPSEEVPREEKRKRPKSYMGAPPSRDPGAATLTGRTRPFLSLRPARSELGLALCLLGSERAQVLAEDLARRTGHDDARVSGVPFP